ncbi:MAG TPA: Spy/CpxP family protein refolding chaperone [Rhizobiales bacterium]|nr:Spy/CpxP family protein refolding chaperone [Hyphomicrobiales bacterium]
MEQEDRTPAEAPNGEAPAPAQPKANWGRRILIGGLAAAAVAGVGLAAATGGEFGRGMGGQGWPMDGRGWGHGRAMDGDGWGRGGPGMHASMGRGFGEYRLERMLEGLDATPEQADKIRAIVDAARDDLMPALDGMRETREKVAELLGAATIDRAAAETLRAERVAAMDQASRRLTAAILDAAEVLTPEQRARLVEHFKERGRPGRW